MKVKSGQAGLGVKLPSVSDEETRTTFMSVEERLPVRYRRLQCSGARFGCCLFQPREQPHGGPPLYSIFQGRDRIPPEQWMIHSSTVALKRCANINLAAHDLSMAEENDICAYKGTRRRVYRGALSRKNMSCENQQT